MSEDNVEARTVVWKRQDLPGHEACPVLPLDKELYRYESAGGRFVAEVTVDDAGLVIDYGDIWSREVPE